MFACGYGEKYCLGNGRPTTTNEFIEVKIKNSHKIEKIETGISTTGYLSGGRVYICGSIGDKVFETFNQIGLSEEIINFKLGDKSAIFLTKKGDVYTLGEYYR